MIELTRYTVSQEDGIRYFKENLQEANELSSMLVKYLDFTSGRFFTLLPDNIDSIKIQEFHCGGIAVNVRERIPDFIVNTLPRLCNFF